MSEAKYVEFKLVGHNPKTEIYDVVAKEDGFILGKIKWFGRWRQYAFFASPETVFEKTCLSDIFNFLKQLMENRKQGVT